MAKRIALIHATPLAIVPIRNAFAEGWPEAEVWSLLDEDLLGGLRREGDLTSPIVQRICDLATYAARTGANGILFTCSAFTPAMDVAKRLVGIPVLKPDEAMIAAAVEAGTRIGVVATMPATVPVAEAQLQATAAEHGTAVEIVATAVPDAWASLTAGDVVAHDRLIAEAAGHMAHRVDVICLAQFSMARAQAVVQAKVGLPVLTCPGAAVARLKALLA